MLSRDQHPDAIVAVTLRRLAEPGWGMTATPGEFRRILLATDLSAASEPATEWAITLARQHGAELLVVSVIDPTDLRRPTARWGLRWDEVRDRRQSTAQDLVERGRSVGVRVSFLVWTGNPGESIVEAAASERADLVLVGSHSRGAIGRLLLGSVSEHVVRHAPCPVLVVRSGSGAAPAA